MVIIFKPNNEYKKFNIEDDAKILAELKTMDDKELKETEIAIFEREEGDSVRFALYPNGVYTCISDAASENKIGQDALKLAFASYQVIQANQYNLCGKYVSSYSEGTCGRAMQRELTPIGVKYTVQKKDGTLFESYDADLEVVNDYGQETQ